MPIITLFSNQQLGETFGERLTNGLKDLKKKGFENVIVLGNDTPFLNVTNLVRTQTLLEAGFHVIAPDQRGGSWILGLKLHEIELGTFESLPWQTNNLYESLRLFLNAQELEESFDINSRSDLKWLWRTPQIKRSLRAFFYSLFNTINNKSIYPDIGVKFKIGTSVLRGPPSLV